eukprot:COSAG05_NODE_17323_length_327_cov_1.109649_1_plen_51_part_10
MIRYKDGGGGRGGRRGCSLSPDALVPFRLYLFKNMNDSASLQLPNLLRFCR